MIELEKSMYYNAKQVIEVDGEIHNNQKDYDIGRSAEMGKYEIEVIRFTNDEVEFETDKVLRIIESTIKERLSSPPWGI